VVYGKHFRETIWTLFHGSSVPAEKFTQGIALLSDGVSSTKLACVYKEDKHTVLSWLADAAVHCEGVLVHMLHDPHLSEVQRDELCALLSEMRSEKSEDCSEFLRGDMGETCHETEEPWQTRGRKRLSGQDRPAEGHISISEVDYCRGRCSVVILRGVRNLSPPEGTVPVASPPQA